MMRSFALAGLAALISLPVALAQDWKASVDPMDWTRLDFDGGQVVFMKPAEPASLHPQAWLRIEHSPQYGAMNGMRSERILYEADCKDYSLREVSGEIWTGPGLSGRSQSRKLVVSPWIDHGSGSPQGALQKALCPAGPPGASGASPFQ